MVFGYGAAESEAGRKLIKLSGNTDFLIAAGLVLLYVKIYYNHIAESSVSRRPQNHSVFRKLLYQFEFDGGNIERLR